VTTLDFIDKPVAIIGEPRFTVVSLFAGCGGSSLGYMWAGGKVRLAVEWDKHAVETYKLNFPQTLIYAGDIHKLSVGQALDMSGLVPGELDILDGSPPCQGFSMAGKRQFSDSRNDLFREYVRLLQGFKPKVFVMENVPGLVAGKMKLVFAEIMRALKVSGYQVKCKKLNAMYFGVPQSRQRLIFIGIRNDLDIEPSYPKGKSGHYVIVKNAFAGLPPATQLKHISHVWQPIKENSKTYMALLKTLPGENLKGFSMSRRLSYGAISGTIPTGGVCPGYPGSSWPSHPQENRGISVREAARLGSFPDGFLFGDDWRAGARVIGNSVPPHFMQAIAEHIYDNALERLHNMGLEPEHG
jgi:DNA (cytosine-5)-methyltransferase 1